MMLFDVDGYLRNNIGEVNEGGKSVKVLKLTENCDIDVIEYYRTVHCNFLWCYTVTGAPRTLVAQYIIYG